MTKVDLILIHVDTSVVQVLILKKTYDFEY
jgi:hypothetical protein